MSDPQMPMWQRWAQFRFSVIGELLSCPPSKGQLQQTISQLSQKRYRHPIDPNRWIRFGPSTIERWYYKAKDASDPIAVLGRKIRSDTGVRWSMPDVLLQE
jgi:putative transposase